MAFCRQCGQATVELIPPGDNVMRDVCQACGYVQYDNPKILAACIVYEAQRVLWIKRTQEPFAGRWAIPAGFMERGETVEEAACRELVEETGLVLTPRALNLYSVLSLPALDEVYITYFAPLPNHDFHLTEEASDIALLTADEARARDFAYSRETEPLIWRLYRELTTGAIKSRVPLSVELRHDPD